jgi:hypothetical protein
MRIDQLSKPTDLPAGRKTKLMQYRLRLLTCLIIASMTLLASGISGQDMPLKFKKEAKTHSVAKAAIFSAVLPGLGQAYNRKYWKIPIIYAGFGVIGYFVVTNNNEFQQFKEAYLYVANDETYPIDNPYVSKYNETQLKDAMDFYRRNRDLSYILGGLWYTLNILEAYVDAHFFDYDISDDLTLSVKPAVMPGAVRPLMASPGIKVSFKF